MPSIYPGMLHGQAVIDVRNESLARMAPEVFAGGVSDGLYIGAKPGRHHYLDRFIDPIVVEAFESNANGMRAAGYNVVTADIRLWSMVEVCHPFNVIFWWHGPEHLAEDELDALLPRLEASCDTIVLGCPWGTYEQGAVGNNVYEIHRSHLDSDFFESRGYTVECLGMKDMRGSHMTAVKRIS